MSRETNATRVLDLPRERLGAAGQQVLALKDQELFEAVPTTPSRSPPPPDQWR